MGKRERTAAEWQDKVDAERKRFKTYCVRYISAEDHLSVVVCEEDLEKCARALHYAKKKREEALARESQINAK